MTLLERLKIFWVSRAWPNITLKQFAAQMDAAALGEPTIAGVDIGPEAAMSISAVFCAVSLISNSLANCKLILYHRLSDRERERATDHSLYGVLHDEVLPGMTAFQWIRTSVAHLLFWGNAYSFKIRDPYRGMIVGLQIIHPSFVKVFKTKTGALQYQVSSEFELGSKIYSREQIFHVPGLGFDGVTGFSILSLARQSFGLTAATERFGAQFFGSGIHVGGFIEHPQEVSDTARKRLERSIKAAYGGVTKAHNWVILEEGAKFNKNVMPLEDAQFLLTRVHQIDEVARWFNMPPHKLKELTHATYSNIEHQQVEYIQDAIQSWATTLESEINVQLVEPEHRRLFYAEFLLESLLRGDIRSQNEALAIERTNGIISANDWRRIKNMNPIPGPEGEMRWMPSSYMDAAMAVGRIPNNPMPMSQK